MMKSCPACGSTEVNVLEMGDEEMPDLLECEECLDSFEDPDHELAGD